MSNELNNCADGCAWARVRLGVSVRVRAMLIWLLPTMTRIVCRMASHLSDILIGMKIIYLKPIIIQGNHHH